MKQRVSSLDLKILISEIQKSIKDYRLQNIYNLVSNNRSFLLKFSIPDSKFNVVLESGFKVYMTDYQRPTQPQPSNFTTKLRKHLKTKRLTGIKQVGDDRIAVLQFSDGLYYLVLEFFSAGNIILLDADLKILSLFRVIDDQNKSQTPGYSVGDIYTMFNKSIFEKNVESESKNNHIFNKEELLKWIENSNQGPQEKNKVLSINKLCFLNASYLSSDLIQISLNENDIKPSLSCLHLLEDVELLNKVVKSPNEAESKLNALLETPVGQIDGYILSKKNPLFNADQEASQENLDYVYDEFHPFQPTHKVSDNVKLEEIKGYSKTVDKFFTTIELSKTSLSRQHQQATAIKRLQSVKDEHSKKLQSLNDVQELNYKKGYLITLYNEQIEECKAAVQSLIDKQMDWKNIEKLIEMEQSRGNQVAKMITALHLIKNEITISLPDIDNFSADETDSDSSDHSSDSDSDSDSNTDIEDTSKFSKNKEQIKYINVIIDIGQSAFANSSRYFDAKKTAQEKQQKTAKSSALAIKNSEQRVHQDLKKLEKQAKQNVEIKELRPKHWFEKFFWFITNDGYLCIAGRDDIQVDSIYYKYFDNEVDLLVSNDLDGSLKVLIKNPYKNKDVPPTTLIQAGIFSLSPTKAWENKMVTSPWFVNGKGVSKKDYDGSILPSGMLNVSTEKTYLPPCQLVMGVGLLWVGDEETTKKYKDVKTSRDEEMGLKASNPTERYNVKIQELRAMLEKLNISKEKDIETPTEEDDKKPEDNGEETIDFVVTVPNPNQKVQTKIRGKKSKLKKIKEKYSDQDEAERRLRMSVLGTLKQVEKTEAPQSGTEIVNDRTSIIARKERKMHQQVNQLNKLIDDLESKNDDDEDKDADSSESVDTDPYYVEISGLIPSPNKTDKIKDCIPVFAPWSSLSKYAYKVKLQPGNLKKGKTIGDVSDFFKKHNKDLQKQGVDWFDEGNYVELVNQQEFMASLTASKFKVTYPGGANDSKGYAKVHKGKGKKK